MKSAESSSNEILFLTPLIHGRGNGKNLAMAKQPKALKTFIEARSDFRKRGITIATWAKENGFEIKLVYAILAGDRKCYRGESHRIAVALGIKEDL